MKIVVLLNPARVQGECKDEVRSATCKEPDGAGLAGPPAVSANAIPLVPLEQHSWPNAASACCTACCNCVSVTQ